MPIMQKGQIGSYSSFLLACEFPEVRCALEPLTTRLELESISLNAIVKQNGESPVGVANFKRFDQPRSFYNHQKIKLAAQDDSNNQTHSILGRFNTDYSQIDDDIDDDVVGAPLLNFDHLLSETNRINKILASYISENFLGIRVARFKPYEYHVSYEQHLRDLGVDLIVIEEPSELDIEMLEDQPDYFYKPQKVKWQRMVRSLEEELKFLPSKKRSRLQSKLQRSCDVPVELGPLTAKDFAEFYDLYETEVIGKERGRRVIDANWANSKSDVELKKYHKLFFRDPSSGQLIGAAIVKLDARNGKATIAYAAYCGEYRNRELSVRTFVEAMSLAKKLGYSTLSYGQDSNFYGHHLTPGLMQYKASLGFKVIPGKESEILKILNPQKLQDQVVFFSYVSTDQLNLIACDLSVQATSMTLPEGIERITYNLQSQSVVQPAISRSIALRAAAKLQSYDPLIQLFEELYCSKTNSISQNTLKKEIPIIKTEKINLSVFVMNQIFNLLDRAKLSADLFLEEAQKRNVLNFSLTGVKPVTLNFPSAPGRLAKALSISIGVEYYHKLMTTLTVELFGSVTALEDTHMKNEKKFLVQFLTNVQTLYGQKGLERLVCELTEIFNLNDLLENPLSVEPVLITSNQGHMSPETIYLDDYYLPEDQNRVRQILRRLHDQIFSSLEQHKLSSQLRFVDNQKEPSLLFFTDTFGGRCTNIALRCLFISQLQLEKWVTAKRFSQLLVDEITAAISSISKIPTLTPQIDQIYLKTKFIIAISNLLKINDYKTWYLQSGLQWGDPLFWGRKSSHYLGEIFDRATPTQRSRLIESLLKEYPRNPEVIELHDLNSQFDYSLSKNHDKLKDYEIDEELKNKVFFVLTSQLNSFRSNVEHFVHWLGNYFEFTGLADVHEPLISPEKLATSIINKFIENHINLNKFLTDEYIHVCLEYAKRHGNYEMVLILLEKQPNFEMSEQQMSELITIILSSLLADEEMITLETLEFLMRAYANEKLQILVLKTIASIKNPYQIWYFESSESHFKQIQFYSKTYLEGLPQDQIVKFCDTFFSSPNQIDQKNSAIPAHLFLIFDILFLCGISRDHYWKHIQNLAISHPFNIYSLLRELVVYRQAHLNIEDQLILSKCFGVIASNPETETKNFEWFLISAKPQINPIEYLACECPFDINYYSRPSFLLSQILHYRSEARLITDDEQLITLKWQFENNSSGLVNKSHLVAFSEIQKIVASKKRDSFVELFRNEFSKIPFANHSIYQYVVNALAGIEFDEAQNLYEELFCQDVFFLQHPWTTYGYSTAVIDKLAAFNQQNDFFNIHRRLLVDFLMSAIENPFGIYWVERLLLSTPDKGFHTIVRFLQYWQSLTQKFLQIFFQQRQEELLGTIRVKITRQVLGADYEKIKTKILANQEAHQTVSPGLTKRLNQLDWYHNILTALAHSTHDEEQDLKNKLDKRLLSEFPPNLNPKEEMNLLINFQTKSFFSKLGFTTEQKDLFLISVVSNKEFWGQTGILDRLVQFSSFADEDGLQMLRNLLGAYLHPTQTVKNENRLDYQGKFKTLLEDLCCAGIDVSMIDLFIKRWRLLSESFPLEEPNSKVVFTNDLERWAKHGEEPKQSCQRISSASGNMSTKNWNYQFGPNPNKSGRPLARPLLGQLKLVEHRVNGKVKGRVVIEVAVKQTTKGPQLALLVERPYCIRPESTEIILKIIKNYAENLGIEAQNILLWSQMEDPVIHGCSDYKPLPERFRIYRDTFGPLTEF